ncbi:hypothetical protein GON01_12330 [Sphingomonas sp. MAH-20]|uniref:Uncharacterized protein n=1 Tax=Sphingomonas horti TaxID=2682842 RepID=A0A6I4J311_9SPHN|nr:MULTISPECIES: hypothetical protein [Sphingomonas]MBA2918685.1 hypothetical protein [Sphingomonas sp. CGMCC 1.13658]MVO78716.1 hypothetical protein [Sphingomonas horti]
METLDEREVAFYFTKAQVRQEQTVSAIEAIPREFWAVVAVVTDGLPPTVH